MTTQLKGFQINKNERQRLHADHAGKLGKKLIKLIKLIKNCFFFLNWK